jgi:hypothetical protein
MKYQKKVDTSHSITTYRRMTEGPEIAKAISVN